MKFPAYRAVFSFQAVIVIVALGCGSTGPNARTADQTDATTNTTSDATPIQLTLEKSAVEGESATTNKVTCDECQGTGWSGGEKEECVCRSFSEESPSPNCVFCKGTGFNPCVFCHGTGMRTAAIRVPPERPPLPGTCHTCDGAGRVACDTCGGRGRIKKTVSLDDTVDDYECAVCSGSGRTRCVFCGGSGLR